MKDETEDSEKSTVLNAEYSTVSENLKPKIYNNKIHINVPK